MQCSYGCGKEAIKQFKTGNWCCSESPNQCSARRIKDSNSKKGKRPLWMSDWPDGVGKPSPNKGKTLEQLYGEDKAKSIILKMSQNAKRTNININEETEKVRKEKLSKIAKERKFGGYVKGSGRGKKQWYESKMAGRVFLDSSYEVAYAKWLDDKEIQWKKNLIKFPYEWESQTKYYIPDFYLIDEDLYIEVKGYETDKDKAKWAAFPFKLKIMKREQLKELGLEVK